MLSKNGIMLRPLPIAQVNHLMLAFGLLYYYMLRAC